MTDRQKFFLALTVTAILLLGISVTLALFCITWPSGFYVFLRLIVCAVLVEKILAARSVWSRFVLLLLAILYNPVIQIHLGDSDLWIFPNIFTVVILVIFLIRAFLQKKRRPPVSEPPPVSDVPPVSDIPPVPDPLSVPDAPPVSEPLPVSEIPLIPDAPIGDDSPEPETPSVPVSRYFLAVLACFGLLLLHGVIGALLGWKHGGGLLVLLLLFFLMKKTWSAIVKKTSDTPSEEQDPAEEQQIEPSSCDADAEELSDEERRDFLRKITKG